MNNTDFLKKISFWYRTRVDLAYKDARRVIRMAADKSKLTIVERFAEKSVDDPKTLITALNMMSDARAETILENNTEKMVDILSTLADFQGYTVHSNDYKPAVNNTAKYTKLFDKAKGFTKSLDSLLVLADTPEYPAAIKSLTTRHVKKAVKTYDFAVIPILAEFSAQSAHLDLAARIWRGQPHWIAKRLSTRKRPSGSRR